MSSPVELRRASMVLALTLAAMSVFGPFTIDTAFPAFKQMGTYFHASDAIVQQLVSVYLLAFALASVFHGPLSDALGRKPVVITGALLYAASSIGCALSPSIPMLLTFRAAQGMTA